MAEKTVNPGVQATAEEKPKVTEGAPTIATAPTPASSDKMSTSTSSPAVPPPSVATGNGIDTEELLVHIKGIKFQHPEFGFNKILKEIQKLGGPYSKLKDQKLRKVMKKNGLLQSQLEEDNKRAGVIQMYTVGDASRPHVHAKAPNTNSTLSQGGDLSNGRWIPVELDVPGDRSGKLEHQAIIKMRQTVASTDDPSVSANVPGATILKVQIAMPVTETPQPMLAYDKDRRKSTFIHPDMPGYDEIRHAVSTSIAGKGEEHFTGVKAYFFAKQNRQSGKKFILLNVREPAPWQSW